MSFDSGLGICRGTVLLAEDDPIASAVSARALRDAGYTVSIAPDGETALTMLCEQSFDQLVTDAQMPGMSGFELVRAMRGDNDLRRTPVLFVTGCSRSSDLSRGYRAGADAYLMKPILPDELVQEVDALLMHALHTQAQLGASVLSGRLDAISLVAALVFLNSQGQSGILRLSRPGADGEITIRDGEPIDARVGRALRNHEALATMVGWNAGTFRFECRDVSKVERRLSGPLTQLLTDADGLRRAP